MPRSSHTSPCAAASLYPSLGRQVAKINPIFCTTLHISDPSDYTAFLQTLNAHALINVMTFIIIKRHQLFFLYCSKIIRLVSFFAFILYKLRIWNTDRSTNLTNQKELTRRSPPLLLYAEKHHVVLSYCIPLRHYQSSFHGVR